MNAEQLMAELRAQFGNIGPALQSLNERIAAEKTESEARSKRQDDALNEVRERLERNERLVTEEGRGVRISKIDGKAVPEVSRECAIEMARIFKAGRDRTLQSSVGADGGYLIHPEFMTEILEIVTVFGQYRKYARVVPMNSNQQVFPAMDGNVEAYWIDENGTVSGYSQPAFSQVTLNAKRLAAIVPAPEELLDDSTPGIGQIIAEVLGRATARREDLAGFTGTGAGGQNPFYGLLFKAGVASVVAATGHTTIASMIADRTLADNLLDMQDAIATPANEGAVYFCHRSIFNKLRRLKDSTGQYIYQSPGDGLPGLLWDKPVVPVEVMPTASGVGASTACVVYGNPRYMMLGDRKQVSFAVNDSVRFENFALTFRVGLREAIEIAQPTGFAKLVTSAT